jgi:hypothetical protein
VSELLPNVEDTRFDGIQLKCSASLKEAVGFCPLIGWRVGDWGGCGGWGGDGVLGGLWGDGVVGGGGGFVLRKT